MNRGGRRQEFVPDYWNSGAVSVLKWLADENLTTTFFTRVPHKARF
jgi:hypothetical protein